MYNGGGNGNPLQHSCLENPIDREVWWATVYGAAKSQTLLSTHVCYWIQSGPREQFLEEVLRVWV